MRKVIIFVALFMLLSVPAMAVSDDIAVEVTIDSVLSFEILNTGPITFTYTLLTQYDAWTDIGDISYNLYLNTQNWQVAGEIVTPLNGWDTTNWKLAVNAIDRIIKEGGTAVPVDGNALTSPDGPIVREPGTYPVSLYIPFAYAPLASTTPECIIKLTASTL